MRVYPFLMFLGFFEIFKFTFWHLDTWIFGQISSLVRGEFLIWKELFLEELDAGQRDTSKSD